MIRSTGRCLLSAPRAVSSTAHSLHASTMLSILLTALPVTWAAAAEVPAELVSSITAADLKAHLSLLASPALEGRESTERGGAVTEEYVAAEFGKYGLKPLGPEGSYFQAVPLLRYLADTDKTTIRVMTSPGKASREVTFHLKTDFSGNHPADMTVEAPVVFAGFGITAPEVGYDDYKGLDVKGKIVLIMEHEPQEADERSVWNGTGLTLHATPRMKILNAQNHGAVGILMANEPARTHPSTPERMATNAGLMERTYNRPRQALAISDQRIPVYTVFDGVVEEVLSGSGTSLRVLQDKINRTNKPASFAIGDARVKITAANRMIERVAARNVIGMIEGTDERLKADTIVFGAHSDHDGVHEGRLYPGADDDGSGTVGILELARAFTASDRKPKRSLLFAVWCSEEKGLLGAYHYVAHPLRPLASTVAMIQFDMIGRDETARNPKESERLKPFDTSREVHLVGAMHVPDLQRRFAEANRSIGLQLVTRYDEDTAENLYQRSDHFPFVLAGRPALWVFTGFHPDYHQTTDTVEKINFGKMEKIVRLTAAAGWQLANSADQPGFIAMPRAGSARP